MVATRKSTIAALASLFASSVAAQTYTSCNPLKNACPADTALGSSVAIDFTQGASDLFDVTFKGDKISYNENGIGFTVAKSGDNPTIQSKFHIMFGRTEAIIMAAPGVGIVSSFVLQSDDLDEIDLEWLGGDTTQVQTNWFSKGDTTTYDRGGFTGVNSPQTVWHNYTVDWTDQHINWYLDGALVRQLLPNNGEGFPQTPMNIRIGAWAGGDSSNAPGTIAWSGGLTDYSKGPFTYYLKSLLVEDYSTGTEYQYTDNTGSMSSIKAVGGQVLGALNGGTSNNIKNGVALDPVAVSGSSTASSSAGLPTSIASAVSSSTTSSTVSSSVVLSSTTSSTVSSSTTSSTVSSSTTSSTVSSSTTSSVVSSSTTPSAVSSSTTSRTSSSSAVSTIILSTSSTTSSTTTSTTPVIITTPTTTTTTTPTTTTTSSKKPSAFATVISPSVISNVTNATSAVSQMEQNSAAVSTSMSVSLFGASILALIIAVF